MARAESSCQPDSVPEDLPHINQVVDSAALARAIGEVTFSYPRANLLFSLAFGIEGELTHVRVLESGYGPDTADVLQRSAQSTVRPQPPENAWGVRLRVATGPNPTLVLERAAYCPPEAIRQSAPHRQARRSLPRLTREEWALLRSLRSFRMKVLVDARGRALTGSMTRGSGNASVDDYLVEWVALQRFRPAVLDGVLVLAWVELDASALNWP
ncbi:MAG: hypothetical protein GTN62_10055 [Gemmatimonadales bacterium]|nr:hypothetical protein [Gemmatimonadales bacterium]NIN11888.1 hypothetical protein [Gemmatimonadales bacterium]NIN50438.1 hypothetical protein [Gemmatimonadales bacterium]NIP07902.1 hypothetical protein [Gemmatimonadales bacterium]NIR01926.1 hypothetical protein [Gemmatimonadales bacterium]